MDDTNNTGYTPNEEQGHYVTQQPVYSQQPAQQEQPQSNGMAIAAMVLGILSIVFCYIFYLSIPMGVVGIVLGTIAKRRNERSKGMALAGIITGILGVVFSVLILVFVVSLFAYGFSNFTNYDWTMMN